MGRVAILADDLTGALDTAAPFASRDDAVTVAWRKRACAGAGAFAFDTETRQTSAEVAAAAVLACLPRLRDATIGFKKVDSLMRGNSIAELAACARSTEFGSVVIAPAFPEHRRITRAGRQLVPGGGADEGPVAIDVAGSLAGRDIAVRVYGRGEAPTAPGVAVCDAETPDDLAQLVSAGARLSPPVLWCGSAGLARALGHPLTVPSAELKGRRLLVVGTRHPVSVAQADRLREQMAGDAVVVEDARDVAAKVRRVGEVLGAGGSCALVFALPRLAADEAEAVFAAGFADLAGLAPPTVLVVTGGDTLYRLCHAIGAGSLAAIGEWSPGVPVSRIAGGAWDGAMLISKSGAYGDPGLLVRILDNAAEDARG